MESNVTRSVIQMEPGELSKLLTEVKETVAKDVDVTKTSKTFSAANLWKIQRSRRVRLARRASL